MLRSLPPLALALGTPAYGSAAVPGPFPDEPPPAALTPHIPMSAVGRPTPHLATTAVGARPDSVRPDSLRRDGARPAPAAAPRAARADTVVGEVAWPASGDFDALVASVRGGPSPAPVTPPAPVPKALEASASAPGASASTAPAASDARAVPVARILGLPARERGAAPVRLEVSVEARTLVALQGDDTLLVAAAGVGTGDSVRYGARTWRFETPAGRRTVRAKQTAPVWVPPEWHYAELAAKRGFTLRHLAAGRAAALSGGRRLVVRGDRVGVVDRGGAFTALPTDQEIVFDGVLYVPPFGTANRRIPGQLGAYRLDLGDGFLIHGTPVESTVGTPSSHGCIRLAGDALAWAFANVPVGTEVTIR